MSQWFFLYQQKGGEEDWQLELADKRGQIVDQQKPAFVTVLDLSGIPDDGDWSRTRYRGPFYADFDADGDLDLACEMFKAFLGRLDGDLGFDISQARLFASGGKGFHVEIPQECFMAKVPAAGVVWLPYVYEHMARTLVVETMDMRVYSGKRGRMWRTPGVKRDNGNYKVPIALDDALTMTPELYLQLVAQPAADITPTPPHCNTKFAIAFDNAREKVTKHMRGRKRRQEVANRVLDPWKKANKTPPTIEMLMDGDNIAPGAQFQQLSMQLSIYATSVGMGLDDFVNRCQGLCEKHISDSRRYNTVPKRREELARMWRYMNDNALYEFDTGPIAALVKPGVGVPDLGVMEKEDADDRPASTAIAADVEDGDPVVEQTGGEDLTDRVRRNFFMNGDGMWKTEGDTTQCVSRAVLRAVEAFYDLEKNEFRGYEFDIWVKGERKVRTMLSADVFASAQSLKKFFVAHQLAFQGGEYETMSLLDIMAEKAGRGGRTYTYPREGFFVVNNPSVPTPEPVKVYLTQDTFRVSVPEDHEAHFRLRYRPTSVTSAYNIDVHKAPELDETMAEPLHDLFRFSRPDVCADLLGWFIACHYRSAYLHLFNQFPMLQIYGEAGAGKSQSAWLLAHLHWYMTPISIKSADGFTPFALDAHASSSTSAPLIIDEFKPRELRKRGGMYEKLKSVLKASYIGADIGERGTVNKGAENHLALVKSKATTPIAFIGEAIEMETAIIERSVNVNIHKGLHTPSRTAAFLRLQNDPSVLSSLGRELVTMGFSINLASMKKQVEQIRDAIAAGMPSVDDDTRRRAAPRMIFNRAVIVHALRTLQTVLARRYGTEFDEDIESLLGTKGDTSEEEGKLVQLHAMSEMSKVLNRVSILSKAKDKPWEVKHGEDYLVGDGWIEVKVERAYDQYRSYCASIADTPLFDNLDVFMHALNAYSPCIDRTCATSDLRKEGDASRIVRMDSRRLMKEGVQPFKV